MSCKDIKSRDTPCKSPFFVPNPVSIWFSYLDIPGNRGNGKYSLLLDCWNQTRYVEGNGLPGPRILDKLTVWRNNFETLHVAKRCVLTHNSSSSIRTSLRIEFLSFPSRPFLLLFISFDKCTAFFYAYASYGCQWPSLN